MNYPVLKSIAPSCPFFASLCKESKCTLFVPSDGAAPSACAIRLLASSSVDTAKELSHLIDVISVTVNK